MDDLLSLRARTKDIRDANERAGVLPLILKKIRDLLFVLGNIIVPTLFDTPVV
jgi:hypothetical protein